MVSCHVGVFSLLDMDTFSPLDGWAAVYLLLWQHCRVARVLIAMAMLQTFCNPMGECLIHAVCCGVTIPACSEITVPLLASSVVAMVTFMVVAAPCITGLAVCAVSCELATPKCVPSERIIC